MIRMNFQEFLEETDDFLIPPGMNTSALSPTIIENIKPYRDVRYSTVDSQSLTDFLRRTIDDCAFYEDFWSCRCDSTVQAVAVEMVIQRDMGLIALNPSQILACNPLEWMVDA